MLKTILSLFPFYDLCITMSKNTTHNYNPSYFADLKHKSVS
jgi:hypothetical protein